MSRQSEYMKRWRAKQKAEGRDYDARYRAENPEKRKETQRLTRIKVFNEKMEYIRKYMQQKGCKLCKRKTGDFVLVPLERNEHGQQHPNTGSLLARESSWQVLKLRLPSYFVRCAGKCEDKE